MALLTGMACANCKGYGGAEGAEGAAIIQRESEDHAAWVAEQLELGPMWGGVE